VRLLEPTLLPLLQHGPAHSYTMIDQLSEFGLGDMDPSAVYRALRHQEEKRWVASTWDEEQTQGPPRRVYSLTALGGEVLRWWTHDLEETRRIIDDILSTSAQIIKEGESEHH
jgi:DNA-binding PadR family transcriptional regulator